jgi:multisubunit Na+/H+ antiporter MnhG subunit
MVRPDPGPQNFLALAALVGVAWAFLPRRQAWVATAVCAAVLWLLLHPSLTSHFLMNVDVHTGGVIRHLRAAVEPWHWRGARLFPPP